MGLFGKIGLGAMAALLLLMDTMPVCAGIYIPRYQVPAESLGDYMVLEEDLGEYEVCEGDCLWNISENFLGSGEKYSQLMEMNPDVITDPNLIYPHTCLRIKRNVYVRKQGGTAGTQMGTFRFGALPGWTVGIAQAGDAWASFAFMRADGARIVCRIRDKEQVSVDALSDWEECQSAIEKYAEEHYGNQITDLTFQRYQSERNDEIYLFTYVYTVIGEQYGLKGTLPVYVSHGICQTEHIQAEFVGFHTEDGMEDVVRYLVAGFEEQSSAESGKSDVNDYNITLGPSKEWDLSGVLNSFGWIQEYFDGVFGEAVPTKPEEQSAKDRVLNSGGR